MNDNLLLHLQGWIPYKFVINNNELLCRWLYVNDKPFIEPFFDETIGKCLALKENSARYKSVSDIAFLQQCSSLTTVQPTAIIFHVSRCGSTAVSQLLSIPQNHIVLSEVPFFDEVLRLPFKQSQPANELLLKAAVTMYSQRRKGGENRVFIKTDSWHIFFHKQLRSLYPNVPFVLLYRSPLEVLASHQKQRGMHVVPGIIEKHLFGFTEDDVSSLDLDAYAIRVLERYFEEYLHVIKHDENAMLVNYNEGVLEIMEKIASATGIHLDESDLQLMKDRSAYHSKHPLKRFAEKHDSIQEPCHEKVIRLYNDLEQIRVEQVGNLP